MSKPPVEVIVIGAGLAGMTAAIALQQAGHQVLVIDRRTKAGGLCGTTVLDGFEFTMGCNDFGSAFERTMHDLGVDIDFTHPRSIFHTARGRYVVPPTPATVARLLRHSPDLFRFSRALRAAKARGQYGYVGELLEQTVKSRDFADLVSIICWPFGTAPKDFRVDTLIALFSKEFGNGHDHHRVVPVGGPGVLAERLAARLQNLGGELKLGTHVQHVDTSRPLKSIETTHGSYQAHTLVSSQGRLDLYPEETKPSLAVGALHLAVAPGTPFPHGVHTVLHMPADAPSWLARLDNGEFPDTFAFNIFPCEFLDERDYLSFTAYFMFPRGVDDLAAPDLKRVENYILGGLDVMLPGFVSNIRYKRLVTPKAYRTLHDLPSNLSPAITPAGFRKPDGYDAQQDIHYVGTTVQPPCEHAESALLSGLRAAQTIIGKRESGRTGTVRFSLDRPAESVRLGKGTEHEQRWGAGREEGGAA
jgi:phytoene dehydrogenase-like protein